MPLIGNMHDRPLLAEAVWKRIWEFTVSRGVGITAELQKCLSA
jgi:hypothetical protein